MRFEAAISWRSILSCKSLFKARPLVSSGVSGLGSALEAWYSCCLGVSLPWCKNCRIAKVW